MGLKVWLPLNGDLHNQGVSNATIINNGATVNASGKIGSCYAFNGSNQYLYTNYNFYNTQYSISAWIYSASASATQTIICDRTTVGYGFSIFLIGGKIRIDPGGNNIQWTTNYTYPTNTWFHLSITYNGTKVSYYINGEFKQEYTCALASNYWGNVTSFGASQASGSGYGNYLNGRLNDIRIYNHCLSAAEVREISQGLMLHYKLDQNITVGENIMPNSLDMPLGSANPTTGTWRTAGSNNMTRSRVAITDTPEGSGYGFQNSGIQTANDASCYGIDNFPTEANTEYVISMWARITAGTEGYAGFAVQKSTLITGWQVINKGYRSTKLPSDGSWTKCWMSFKTDANTTRNIYIGITTGDTSVTTQMCNVHLEKGILPDMTIIQDSSGYNNNGTIVGTPTINFNPARYNNSTYIDTGVDSRIITPTLTFDPRCVTLNIWIKSTNKTPTGDYHMVVDSNANRQWYEMAIYKTGYFRGGLFVNGARKADNGTSTKCLDGNWHMLTISYDGTNVNRYVDSIMEKATAAAYSSGLSTPTALTLGRDGPNASYAVKEMSLSDFRIYNTALSADDIKQLYEVGAKVDNKGNLHTFEVNENGSNKLTKTGILKDYIVEPFLTLPDGSKWQLLLYHYVDGGANLFTQAKAPYCNEFGLYSRLQYADNFTYDNKYEFYVLQDDIEYRWTQTNKPTATSPSGFTAISGYTNAVQGLVKPTSLTQTYFGYNSWWGACGSWTSYSTGGKTGIPGFGAHSAAGMCTKYLALYARVTEFNAKIANLSASANNFIEI